VLAPYVPRDAALQKRVARLRSQGTPVVVDLPGHGAERGESNCDRRLVRRKGNWVIEKV
jgi:hypothetical protein